MYKLMHETAILGATCIGSIAFIIGWICVKLGGKKLEDIAIKCFKVSGALLFGVPLLVILLYMPEFLEWIREGILE